MSLLKSKHMDFCDYLFFARQMKKFGIVGDNDMYHVRDILTECHIGFLDKYILGDDSKALHKHKFDCVKKHRKYK
ncbi:hypothetical protein [Clostridium fungisolvens]|uniref:hypothetical protein n=1 Tax=Clostridium fungisolvens TaxID=1604897 RepID=UPI00160D854C|nr:hypothetical protein [Clostridium fungisolvens]